MSVTYVPGDVPELTEPVLETLAATGVALQWEHPDSEDLDAVVQSLRRTGAGLLGWRAGARTERQVPPAVALRRAMGVHAQERPVRDVPGVPGRFSGVDLVVVRETTEDVYAMLEHETIPDVFESLKVTTQAACERIARHAFELAVRQDRKRVTIVHKANIMKLSDGMFLATARRVAEDYPEIACDDVIVDALCMKVVLDPTRFDVLVCGNLFGDIVSDVCAGLVGGPSNTPSVNRADGATLFTAGHGDPPDVAGTGRANPLPLLLPALHLLDHLGQADASTRLGAAISASLADGIRPVALGGEASAAVFCAAVRQRLG